MRKMEARSLADLIRKSERLHLSGPEVHGPSHYERAQHLP
jgi:hypothetical protein